MKADDRFRSLFGTFQSLSDEVPWTTGLSNMIEYLLWDTKYVLGISKTQFWKLVATKLHEHEPGSSGIEDKKKYVEKLLAQLVRDNDVEDRYAKPKRGYCSPNEALRRAKYFSEDYLNKEFDIFLSLCSDAYLDAFYSQFVDLKLGEQWSVHGNSGYFRVATQISEMQMDNLAYNDGAKLLVANELKLGGQKNPDQFLKYAFMYRKLIEKSFIDPDTKFLLLIISDKPESIHQDQEIVQEIEYCRVKSKNFLLNPSVLDTATQMLVNAVTWGELSAFNGTYSDTLSSICQVEKKLLSGFNLALKEKAFFERT